MMHLFNIKKNQLNMSLIFLIVGILVVCSAGFEADFYNTQVSGIGSESSISDIQSEPSPIITNELSSITFIKNVITRNSGTNRVVNTRSPFILDVVNLLFLFFGMYAFYHICVYKSINSSNRYIITYIHNLDGMKS